MSQQSESGLLKLKFAGLLLSFAELDRMIEISRQALTCFRGFEPYSAFQRLVRSSTNPMGVTPGSLDTFMRETGFNADLSSLETVVHLYSARLAGLLDFEDFLRMVLSREASDARFEAAKRAVPDAEICPEIEYLLARLLSKLSDSIRRLKVDSDTQMMLNDSSNLFSLLGGRQQLDFSILQAFFKGLGLVVKDSDVLAVLRIVDINDDGVIDRSEFEFFISLFNVRNHSNATRETLASKIKLKSKTGDLEPGLSRSRARETRDEFRTLSFKESKASLVERPERERLRKSNVAFENKESKDLDRTGNRAEPTYQRYERTYYREEKVESPSRSVSKSVGTFAKERRVKREENKHRATAESFNYTPLARQNRTGEEDFSNVAFRALKPLNQDDDGRQDHRISTGLSGLKTDAYSYKRSVVEDKLESSIPRARNPTKTSTPVQERRSQYTRDNLRRNDRDLSASKGGNPRIKESLRVEEVVRSSRDYPGTSDDLKHKDGFQSSSLRKTDYKL